jgi:hypothetical protein
MTATEPLSPRLKAAGTAALASMVPMISVSNPPSTLRLDLKGLAAGEFHGGLYLRSQDHFVRDLAEMRRGEAAAEQALFNCSS